MTQRGTLVTVFGNFGPECEYFPKPPLHESLIESINECDMRTREVEDTKFGRRRGCVALLGGKVGDPVVDPNCIPLSEMFRPAKQTWSKRYV
jgi:hypothetical protein